MGTRGLGTEGAAQKQSIEAQSGVRDRECICDSPGRARSMSDQRRTFGSRLPCPNWDTDPTLQQKLNISATSEARTVVKPVPRSHKSPLSVVKEGRKIEEEMVKKTLLSARLRRLNSAEVGMDCGPGQGLRTPSVTQFQFRLAVPYIPIG